MRIAQVAPLHESVPPRCYGGTERVVSWLTEALVSRGHTVTLFASGDSRSSAQLVPVCPRALRSDPLRPDPVAYHVLALERVARRAKEFDLIHFHSDVIQLPMARRLTVPHVTTMHGRLDIPGLAPLFAEFADVPLVSITDAQRSPLPHAHWVGTVHHGLPPEAFRPGDGSGAYLAFLGRISPEKRPDRAIEIARRVGMPLKIAAKVDRADAQYFADVIRPLLDHPLVEFVGEIGDAEKADFLGRACGFLFPIDWPEPFGLVMIEAMACGTPVVAYRHGSVPEVLEDGVTGYVVDDLEEAVRAVARLDHIDRTRCRQEFERRFSVEAMVAGYERVYEGLCPPRPRPRPDQCRRAAAVAA